MNTVELEIAVRAYTERPGEVPLGAKPTGGGLPSSKWSLVFDCETSVDAAQHLRVGFFQIREGSRLHTEGLFFDPDNLSVADREFLEDYATRHNLIAATVREFRKNWLLQYGYRLGGKIIGFNLPFDIARIALAHAPSRRSMRGGFSFTLTEDPAQPRIRVKHLSPRAALIDFAKPGKQETGRGMRNRRLWVPPNRGHFVDVKTLAAALLSKRFTLGSLASALPTSSQKLDTDEHGSLSETYLDYARTDAQVTWECFWELKKRYDEHGLSKEVDRILSEATIGKAYLQEMGITPFLGCNPDFPRSEFGQIMCAYYGGRAEVHIRRQIREVLYCDFKSMYPTVNSLMGLWDFVIADGVIATDSTKETRSFLEEIGIDQLQTPASWKNLNTLVKVAPESDLFPVRAKYNGKTHTIGVNYLSSQEPLWYTLADCIAAKLLSGKCPKIEKAVTYTPGSPQKDLKPIQIMGREDYEIDPIKDDLFRRLVDLRDEAKARNDDIQQALKILVNSTSYGIFIEVNRDDAPKSEKLAIYGPNGDCTFENSKAIEEPGRFFHPLLAILITGAARLMLAIAERRTLDLGLDWAFCDTDSLAITRPNGMARKEFQDRANKVIHSFESLNPYKKKGSILEMEGINFGVTKRELEPLFCYAISAKRYCLFNLDANGEPILRKASAHGLGHVIDPYSDEDAPDSIPGPRVPLNEIGVHRWQHDFWVKIVQATIEGHPDQVALNWHPDLSQPAAMRYTASSPAMLGWLDCWNDGKAVRDKVRPFGFLLSFMPRIGVFAPTPDPEEGVVEIPRRGRPLASDPIRPIAPFDSDPLQASREAFDRISGEPVASDRLKTYSDSLIQYHLSPEDKFAGADYFNHGPTERRHVLATGIVLIGKEANRIGQERHPNPLIATMARFCNAET